MLNLDKNIKSSISPSRGSLVLSRADSSVQESGQTVFNSKILILLTLIWPIYWLPRVPLNYYENFKDIVLFFFILPAVIPSITGLRITKLRNTPSNQILLWLVLVVICSLPGVIASQNLQRSLLSYLRYILIIPLYVRLTMLFIQNPHSIKAVFRLLPIPVVISCIFILLEISGFFHFSPPGRFLRAFGSDEILMGLSYRTNGMSISIAYIIPILVYFGFMDKQKFLRIIWLSCLAIALFVSSMLMNRGGFIAAILGGLISYIFVARKINRILFIITFILVSYVLFFSSGTMLNIALYRTPEFEQRHQQSDRDFESLDKLSSGRLSRWQTGYEMVTDLSLFGKGFKQDIGQEDYSSSGFHNLFINQFVDAGIVGGIVMIGFFLTLLKMMYRKFNKIKRGFYDIFFIIPSIMLLQHFILSMIQGGSMFQSVYLGITFYFSLAALVILPDLNRRQRWLKINRKPIR